MISPIQLADFVLHEVYFAQNPEWIPPENGQVVTRVLVRGTPMFGEAPSEASAEIPLTFNVFTSLDGLLEDGTADAPVQTVERGRTYSAFLRLGINEDEETAARAPFTGALACSAVVGLVFAPDDEEEREAFARVVRANAAGMLYGMARSILLSITRSTNAILLPSLTFQPIVEMEIGSETV